MDDAQLLHQYAAEGSEPAFGEFVQRHIGWVYHAAQRRAGGRHDLAEEIAQYVFTAAARNAVSLARRRSVNGWLYITLRHAASRALRAEARRLAHETAAHAMNEIETENPAAEWEQVRPALDEVMDRLPETDRDALLLRYFEGRGLREIGAALDVSEDGARKRVDRALEKLRGLLARRGVTSTASALGTLLAARASAAVAPEMQVAITAGALTGTAVPGAAMLGVVHFMSATKAILGGLGLAAAAICLITGGAAVYETREARAREQLVASLQRDYDAAEARLRVSGERLALSRANDAGTQAAVSQQTGMAPAAVAAAEVATATREVRRADGQAFLDTQGGMVRAQYRERAQAEIFGKFALFFRVAGVDPQRQRTLAETLGRRWEETLEVTPTSIAPGVQSLTPDEMQAILGADGWRQWQDFDGRARAANRWALAVAKSAGDAGAPISMEQIAALQRMVREHSADYRDGNSVNDRTVDWAAVYRQSQALLTPAQWQGAQSYLLMRQATHALETLADGGATAPRGGNP